MKSAITSAWHGICPTLLLELRKDVVTTNTINTEIAARLREVAGLLDEQGANQFRIRAYQRAAETLRNLKRPVDKLIKAVSDIHQNKQLDEPTIQELLVLLSCIERLSDDLLAWAKAP